MDNTRFISLYFCLGTFFRIIPQTHNVRHLNLCCDSARFVAFPIDRFDLMEAFKNEKEKYAFTSDWKKRTPRKWFALPANCLHVCVRYPSLMHALNSFIERTIYSENWYVPNLALHLYMNCLLSALFFDWISVFWSQLCSLAQDKKSTFLIQRNNWCSSLPCYMLSLSGEVVYGL